MGKELRYALRRTVPVLCGYLFLGIAFGVLLSQAGYGWPWALLISGIVYAGSMQFALVGLITGGAGIMTTALMTLAVNGRHLFYGVTFLERFRAMGRACPYMVFSLTDETYSLLCSESTPPDLDPDRTLLLISLLDQLYWVAGSVLGGILGASLPFDATGIDFAMTALFLVIFTEQWLAARRHRPALTGLAAGLVCLLVLGQDRFIIPAMLLAAALLVPGAQQPEKEAPHEP